jgi:F-type H+-transporting ATPase subunit b
MWMRLVVSLLVVLALIGYGAGPAFAEKTSSPAEAAESESPESDHAAGHGAGHGGGGDLNPINFEGYNFRGDLAVWTGVIFLVVLAILWKFAWTPISEGLQKREHQIADQISQAEASNQKARQLLEDYQQRLEAARDEVRSIVDQGRRDAEQLGREMLERAKADAAAERDRALQQIESATAGALKELAERSADMAVELAGKIVRTRLDRRDHAQLVQEAVAKFAGNGSKK